MMQKHAAPEGMQQTADDIVPGTTQKNFRAGNLSGARTWAGAPILLAAVEQHVGAARAICGVHGFQGRHVRVIEAVPALALVLSCRSVVPTSQRAIVLADGKEVIHWRHLLQHTGNVSTLRAIACQTCEALCSCSQFCDCRCPESIAPADGEQVIHCWRLLQQLDGGIG